MKSILLHVHNDAGQSARLQAALDMARQFDAHLTCLQAMPFATYAGEPFAGAMFTYEVFAEEMQATREKLEAELAKEDVAWDWVETRGSGTLAILTHCQLADMIVLSPGGGAFDPDAAIPIVGEIAVNARLPMLVVRDGQSGVDFSKPALVAWNGSPEAAQALRSCRNILSKSTAVYIISIEDGPGHHLPASDAATYLSRHGVHAEVVARSRGKSSIAEVLLSFAAESDAGLIVMGAYGHSRLYEFVLGGVTRAMLRDCPLPLLLAH